MQNCPHCTYNNDQTFKFDPHFLAPMTLQIPCTFWHYNPSSSPCDHLTWPIEIVDGICFRLLCGCCCCCCCCSSSSFFLFFEFFAVQLSGESLVALITSSPPPFHLPQFISIPFLSRASPAAAIRRRRRRQSNAYSLLTSRETLRRLSCPPPQNTGGLRDGGCGVVWTRGGGVCAQVRSGSREGIGWGVAPCALLKCSWMIQ